MSIENKLHLQPNSTFKQAIQLLDANGNGFLPIVDEKDFLIGILTDGDIRRAILNGKSNLDEIINKNPKTILNTVPHRQAIHILKTIHRRHLPIIDKEGHYKGVLLLSDLEYNQKKNKIIIMAGGLGSRLGELTKEIPKPMLLLGGKPILEILLDSFLDHGFNDFLISVNYRAEIIKNYFKDGEHLGAKISYLQEKDKLGTAGALSLISNELEEPAIIINGDILTSIDYGKLLDFHNQKKSFATICAKEYESQIPYATLETTGTKVVRLAEKPIQKFLVSAGIYVLSPEAIKLIPKNCKYDMPSLFEKCIQLKKNVNAHLSNEYWLDIGQLRDYENANQKLAKGFNAQHS